jgi:hypothetical protein
MGLPAFSMLWANFPTGSSEEVKRKIGGAINMAWVTNTCVIRVSHALNLSSAPIPNGWPGLSTAAGGNGKRYAYRVSEFKPYLEKKYRKADIEGTTRGAFEGKSGIIMFDVQGWSDATGHFDLWNGSAARYSEYFDKASKIYLWRCD